MLCYHGHNNALLVRIWSQNCPVQNTYTCFFKNYLMLPSHVCVRFLRSLFPSGFLTPDFYVFISSHKHPKVPRLSYPFSFDYPNNIWPGIEIRKLLITCLHTNITVSLLFPSAPSSQKPKLLHTKVRCTRRIHIHTQIGFRVKSGGETAASDGDVRVFPGGHETVSIGDANPRREASHKGLRGTWVGEVQQFISCTVLLFARLVVSPC